VVANCDHLKNLKFSPNLPYVFTEHGAVMAANVLNSSTAINASVRIVRTFIKLREMVSAHKDLSRRLDELENNYDQKFKIVFDAIRELVGVKKKSPKRIEGFKLTGI